jgi:D-xylose transport system permease protein
LTDGTFLRPRNLSLLARQMSVVSILAVGMVLVIVAGQIDLSVGALAGLAGAVSTLAAVDHGWPLPLALLAALALGGLLGLVQGALVARLRVPPFVVTLGGMLVFQGALLGITGGVSTTPPAAYLRIGQSYLPRGAGLGLAGAVAALFLWRAVRRGGRGRASALAAGLGGLAFAALMNAYEGIPLPVLLVLALATALSVVARRTPFGRHLYAIGGNRDAAFYSGIAIERHLVLVFGLMGLLSGIAGIVLTARVGSATSDAGRMMELDAIAAAVIGGTSLLGGQGTIWGALLGALVMASLDNGMSLMNTEAFWQPILKGAILVAAVAADIAGRRERG